MWPSARVQADVSREFAWDLEGNVAVASLQPPGRGQCRPLRRAHFDVSIASLKFELIKAPLRCNVSIASRCMQFAVDAFQIFGAVAAVQIHFALQSGDINLAIARAQVDPALARHLDNNVDAVIAPAHVEVTCG